MSSRAAQGFTLIELVAATLIGSLIVTSALGVFAALDRTNVRFALRYDQTTDMERTYVAVQRALRTMVVSPANAPDLEPIPPRLVLEQMPGRIKMRSPDWASSRVLIVGDERDQPQRLEVVVSESPITSAAGQRLESLGVAALGLDPEEVSLAQPVAQRGSFVLRPAGISNQTQIWQLLWQPMIALKPLDEDAYFMPAPSEMTVVLAENIVWCRWQVFYLKERLLSHTATSVLELPAYIELELELTSGMMANWMFEIAWTEGPELAVALDPLPIAPTGSEGGAVGGAAGETRSGDSVSSPSGTFSRPEGGGVDR